MQNDRRPELDYVEIEISEFCNLNCRGCCDFSNLAKEKKFYEIEEFRKDMSRLGELFSGINKIRLMGGEPLLNPKLCEYAEFTREIFPDSDIRIVTNGLLLDRLTDEQLTRIRAADCRFDISNYPPTRKKLSGIRAILEKAGIDYDIGFPMDLFFRNLRKTPASSPVPAYKNCIFTHCHMMGHGRIAPCSYAYCAGRLNREYGLFYPENDCFDLYSGVSGEEMKEAFSRPHEFCRYCAAGIIPMKWEGGVTAVKAAPEDWIVKENFLNLKVAPAIQSAIKPAAEKLRSLIQNKR